MGIEKRKQYMTVTYSDGTTVDYSTRNPYHLYSAEVPPTSADLVAKISDAATHALFKRP